MSEINQGAASARQHRVTAEDQQVTVGPVKALTSRQVLQAGLDMAHARCLGTPVSGEDSARCFGKCLLTPARSRSDSYFVSWQVRKLMDFLEVDRRPIVTVGQLAGVIGHSRSHFTRLFKNSFGVSPALFLMYRRLEKVRWVMGNSHLKLTDIALQFGFCDQSHFCRSFKRETGISPRAWRSRRTEQALESTLQH
ncbi:AraC family transcriptional regulator [Pseudomonas sp. NPDC090203]|jgi:AraC-like DNA-binding protein|uniref:AraC family transcriptional regulator n=1 Tax=Pseudomonas sp. NPDC090203 TaxID=3364477 RepID=UPI00381D343E